MQAFFGTLFKMLALHSFKLSVILFIINTKDIFQQALNTTTHNNQTFRAEPGGFFWYFFQFGVKTKKMNPLQK